MSELMREVSDELSLAELAESAAASDPVPVPVRPPMLNSVSVTSVAGVPTGRVTIKRPRKRWTSSPPDPIGSV